MGFSEALWYQIGITWPQAVGVVLATTVIYLVFTVVLRIWGQRLYANRSAIELAVMLVLGAVAGRSMLGNSPTLLGGLLCLACLLILESVFGLRYRIRLKPRPRTGVVVMVDGVPRTQVLQRYRLSEHVLWTRLREAGIYHLNEVNAIILEPTGSLSLIRQGQTIDRRLLEGVRDADLIDPDNPPPTG